MIGTVDLGFQNFIHVVHVVYESQARKILTQLFHFQNATAKGDGYTTDYRSTGGRGPPPAPRRRFGGFGNNSGGPAPPPCGAGG